MSATEHGPEAIDGTQGLNILAVETSTSACSVALQCRHGTLHTHRVVPKQHNQLVLGIIDDLLCEAGLVPRSLDAVAFGRGPGSFTGVRIAAGIAQGIGFGAEIPVLPISTLQVLAQTALDQLGELDSLGAVLRSRPGEIYVGGYVARNGLCVAVSGDVMMRVETLASPAWLVGRCGIFGDAADCFDATRLPPGCTLDTSVQPNARALLRLAVPALRAGAGVVAEQALPVYLEGTRPWRKATDDN